MTLRLLAGELRKIRSAPTPRWFLLASPALAVVAAVATLAIAENSADPPAAAVQMATAIHTSSLGAMILSLVAGIIGLAGEYRSGSIDQTFLSDPRRLPTIRAKIVAYLGLGAALGAGAMLAALATSAVWFTTRDISLPLAEPAVWQGLIGAGLAVALLGAFGVALGGLIRSQQSAIVGTLLWFFLVEPAVQTGVPELGRWFPGAAALALGRAPDEALLAMGWGAVMLLAYLAAFTAAGMWRVSTTDA